MTDERDVLAANDAFYDAFRRRDVDALEALWAQRYEIACVHPGWDALHGRDEVLASWRAILEGGAAPAIVYRDATAHLLGDTAFVVCHEIVGGAELVATNVFVREDGGWRIVHHQAGPVSARRPEAQRAPKRKKTDLN